jgi:hypothetical protein
MNIPPEFQDTKYYFGKLNETFTAYEEWLKSLHFLPVGEVAGMTDHIIHIADQQAHLASETADRFIELFPQPPQGVEPQAWEEIRARLRDESGMARDLFYAVRRLYEYVRER